jgi:hypothetical protein
MEMLKLVKHLRDPAKFFERVKGTVVTAFNAKNAERLVGALAVLLVFAAVFMSMKESTYVDLDVPLIWREGEYENVWRHYKALRCALPARLRLMLDAKVRRPLEWMIVMEASTEDHYADHSTSAAVKHKIKVHSGMRMVLSASPIPWRLVEYSASTTERACLPMDENLADSVSHLLTFSDVMCNNIVQVSTTAITRRVEEQSASRPAQQQQWVGDDHAESLQAQYNQFSQGNTHNRRSAIARATILARLSSARLKAARGVL